MGAVEASGLLALGHPVARGVEPELFQVVLPCKVLKDLKIVLNNSKYSQNQIYKGEFVSARLS